MRQVLRGSTTTTEAVQRASNVGNIVGTGLGLAIAQLAAELHGGNIHIESQVGVGTTATCKIPR